VDLAGTGGASSARSAVSFRALIPFGVYARPGSMPFRRNGRSTVTFQ
jgi:hypothetical protein